MQNAFTASQNKSEHISNMAPSRRLLAQLKSELGHSPSARWQNVLAPYGDTTNLSPKQLRQRAVELSLMTAAQRLNQKRQFQREQRAMRAQRRSEAKQVKREYVVSLTVEMPNRSFGRPGEPKTFTLEKTFPDDGGVFTGTSIQETNDIKRAYGRLIDQYTISNGAVQRNSSNMQLIGAQVDYVNIPLPYRTRNLIDMKHSEPYYDASLLHISTSH